MPVYTVTVREEIIRWVQVEADNESDAELKVECDVNGELPVQDIETIYQEIESVEEAK